MGLSPRQTSAAHSAHVQCTSGTLFVNPCGMLDPYGKQSCMTKTHILIQLHACCCCLQHANGKFPASRLTNASQSFLSFSPIYVCLLCVQNKTNDMHIHTRLCWPILSWIIYEFIFSRKHFFFLLLVFYFLSLQWVFRNMRFRLRLTKKQRTRITYF